MGLEKFKPSINLYGNDSKDMSFYEELEEGCSNNSLLRLTNRGN